MPRIDNPLKDGPKSIYDWFVNPVGCVIDGLAFDHPNTITNDDGSIDIIGVCGSVRHSGSFSPDNPYLEQLKNASKNQDKDALYELAVQWEADRANTLLNQEREDYLRSEQREYDLEVNEIARQRAAGLNPDLGGAGSGSIGASSSPQQSTPMADQTGQTKFSNAYDNLELVYEGINTAANLATSFTGVGSAVVGAIDTVATLGSRINVNKAQADLTSANAEAVRQLTPGQVQHQTGVNIAQNLANTHTLAQQFIPTMTDDDMTVGMRGLGYSEDAIPGIIQNVRAYHKNPFLQQWHSNNVVSARKAAADARAYTDETCRDLSSYSVQERIATHRHNIAYSSLQASLNESLMNLDYGSSVAGVMNDAVGLQKEQLALATAQVKQDIFSFTSLLGERDTAISAIDDIISGIEKTAETEGRDFTKFEHARIDQLQYRKQQIIFAKSEQVFQLYDLLTKTSAEQSFIDDNTKASGKSKLGTDRRNRTNNMYATIFNGYLENKLTNDQFGQKLYDNILNGLSTVAKVASAVSDFMPKE